MGDIRIVGIVDRASAIETARGREANNWAIGEREGVEVALDMFFQ